MGVKGRMYGLLGIFIGGGAGSVLRHLLSSRIGAHWGIMTVNILGAFCIGILFEWLGRKTDLRPEWRAFLMTGLLGGFTTFSTYMLDFGLLLNNNRSLEAVLYMLGSLVLGAGALFAGMTLGRLAV